MLRNNKNCNNEAAKEVYNAINFFDKLVKS